MKNLRRVTRKSYALKRMARAIERAIHGSSSADKERAARWAAAWGLLCGINTNAVRLRSSEVQAPPQANNRRRSDQPGAAEGADRIYLPQYPQAAVAPPPAFASVKDHPLAPTLSPEYSADAAPSTRARATAAPHELPAPYALPETVSPPHALAAMAAALDDIPAVTAPPALGPA